MKFFKIILVLGLLGTFSFVEAAADWKSLTNEDFSKRTYNTKDFQNPADPNTRIIILSSGLLHYFDESFKEIPELKFPEGKILSNEKSQYFIMDLPDWGKEQIQDNGKSLIILDKRNQPIYVFKNAFVVSQNAQETEVRNGSTSQPAIVIENDEAIFLVENHQLFVKIPYLKNSVFPLQVFDDVNTTSTNNKDSWVYETYPNTDYSAYPLYYFGVDDPGSRDRLIQDWTLPAGSGVISKIELFLYYYSDEGLAGDDIQIHELTQSFTEPGITWNRYDGVHDWATRGGNYSATVIDKVTVPNAPNWIDFVLQGAGADNPLSLDWEDNFDLLARATDEVTVAYGIIRSKEWTTPSQRPYLLITYTPTPPPPAKPAEIDNAFFGFWYCYQDYFFGLSAIAFLIALFFALVYLLVER